MNGQYSSWADACTGVPQGSIHGHLLFLIYINNFSDGFKSEYKLFADDNSMFFLVHDVNTSAESRRFLGILFSWLDNVVIPKNPNGCSWVSKNIWCFIHLWKDVCVSWNDFCFEVFIDMFHLNFFLKYIWKKCYKNFSGCIFSDAHTVQMVPKYIWMQHWILQRANLMRSLRELVTGLFNGRWTLIQTLQAIFRRKKIASRHLVAQFDKRPDNSTQIYMHLGMMLDSDLSYEHHIKSIYNFHFIKALNLSNIMLQ